MRDTFRPEYETVKAFTVQEVGELKADLRTRDAYRGMSDYINLVHAVSIGCKPAQISFAAPLTFNGFVKAGTLVYNDLFTIYPYENQLFVVRMSGKEIKDYLEYSYDTWINTYDGKGGNLLKIRNEPDPRTGQKSWSFVNFNLLSRGIFSPFVSSSLLITKYFSGLKLRISISRSYMARTMGAITLPTLRSFPALIVAYRVKLTP